MTQPVLLNFIKCLQFSSNIHISSVFPLQLSCQNLVKRIITLYTPFCLSLCIIKCLQQTNVFLASPGGFKFTKQFSELEVIFLHFSGQSRRNGRIHYFWISLSLEANSLARKKLFYFLFPLKTIYQLPRNTMRKV